MAKFSYFYLLLVFRIFLCCQTYIIDYGPVIKATKGAVWPQPKSQSSSLNFNTIRPSVFDFQIIGNSCDTLKNAIDRYKMIIQTQLRRVRNHVRLHDNKWKNIPEYMGHLDVLQIDLRSGDCEKMPHIAMDESYSLTITSEEGKLESFSIWGALRGLETFSQLLYVAPDFRSLVVNATIISDEPRFPHRGILIDTSRHFLKLSTLKNILDGMVYNKLNVFHWHIVDDHSFPYQSLKYPELTKGAYDASMIYSQEDISNIIEYARQRGIRVMVEFDTPGHTASWGASHPEILTECGGPYEGKRGPVNPISDEAYEFIFSLYEEIVKVFPDLYLHLGGDEVGFECWETNQEIVKFMKSKNITSFAVMEEIYIQKLIDKISSLDKISIVWQEVFTNGVKLPNGTVVHIWTGNQKKLLSKVTHQGFPALLSACWYLDHLSTGGDWVKFYKCDAHDFPGTKEQKKLVMGGEACMWGEVVDDINVIQRIFPRASATAEKLWSQDDVVNVDYAMQRMEEHYCRMRSRNIPAQPPNGPGYCLF